MGHDVYLHGATYTGTFRGRKWFIHVHPLLGHPCAYVQVLPNDVWGKEARSDSDLYIRYGYFDLDVNGGSSFFGHLPSCWTHDVGPDCDLECVGWSYDHWRDYNPSCPELNYCDTHKWTYEEILMEIGIAVSNIEKANLEVMK